MKCIKFGQICGMEEWEYIKNNNGIKPEIFSGIKMILEENRKTFRY